MAIGLMVWIAVLLGLEARFGWLPVPRANWPRRVRNAALGLLAISVAPLLIWFVRSVSAATTPVFDLPILAQLVVLDAWAYWLHRLYHRVALLWRLHAPHHLDEHLDVSSAFRFHPGEVLVSGVLRAIPAWLFGIDVATLLLFETMLVAAAAFHHANLAIPPWVERWLSWAVVTPPFHRTHHHADPQDTNGNFAAILSIWDRVFGTARGVARDRGMVIGVAGQSELPLGGLLRLPLAAAPRA